MFEISQDIIDELKAFIDSHDFFFIAGHKEPDGDCIASCLGIAAILDYYKKPYQLLSAGPFKRNEVIRWEDKFSSVMDFQDESAPVALAPDPAEADRQCNDDFLPAPVPLRNLGFPGGSRED